MPGPGHPVKLLRLGGALVGVFAELPGMSFLPGDEKQGAGRNRLNIGKRIEIHELHVAGKRRMRGKLRRLSLRSKLAAGSAVELKKLPLNGTGIFAKFMHSPAGILDGSAGKLHIPLLRRFRQNLLSLTGCLRIPETVPAGSSHVVHADGRNGLQAGINLGGADGKTAATAYPDHADAVPVHKRPRAQIIRGRAERLRIHIRRNGIPGFSVAPAPER